jgi:hypothetical protein
MLNRHWGLALADAGAVLLVALLSVLLVPPGCQRLRPTVTAAQSWVSVRRVRCCGS